MFLWAVIAAQSDAVAWEKLPPYLPMLQQYLGLTDMQVNLLLQANQHYAKWSMGKEREIAAIQNKMARETQAVTAGQLRARIAAVCGEVENYRLSVTRHNTNLLSERQRVQLRKLEDAVRPAPEIEEAQAANLLDRTTSQSVCRTIGETSSPGGPHD